MSAPDLVKAILDDLKGRSGFDEWWHSIDAETQEEIRRALTDIAGRWTS